MIKNKPTALLLTSLLTLSLIFTFGFSGQFGKFNFFSFLPVPVPAGEYVDEYSTTETLTNKTWLGSPVYRKVVDFGALPNATSKAVAHNITNLNNFISIKGVATNGTTYFPLPHVSDQTTHGITMYCNTTNVQINTYDDRSTYTAYVILEYTKTE